MLSRLSISHIALIEQVDIDFPDGFVVLTGETGAGKSILIDAMKMVLGGRADRTLIAPGQRRAYVEAVFRVKENDPVMTALSENGLDAEDGSLVLARELNASGKNTCRIDGVMVSTAVMQSVAEKLIDIYGQHEHQSLLKSTSHLSYLDENDFTGAIHKKKQRVAALYEQLRTLKKKLSAGFVSPEERERQLDILRFQVKEIESAHLQTGEEEGLRQQMQKLSAAESIQTALQQTYEALAGEDDGTPAVTRLGNAAHMMTGIAPYDPGFEVLLSRISSLFYEADDTVQELRRAILENELDQGSLEAVGERLEEITRLKRKYGQSIEGVLAFSENAAEEIERLESQEELMAGYQEEYETTRRAYYEAAVALSESRKENARLLTLALLKQLQDLGMEKTQLEMAFEPLSDFANSESDMSAGGLDRVSFLLSPNPGIPPRPLEKVASGGELSRIMLAFKSISAEKDGVDAMIFDEIDTGIGGKMAAVVAQKLAGIAAERQVICVTHHASVAAMARAQLLIEKRSDEKTTSTYVHYLEGEAREKEIARMLSGSEGEEISLEHARLLLDKAQAFQKEFEK